MGLKNSDLKFVPPAEDAKGRPRYASYVVGDGMKVHGRLCDAKNSFNNRGWKQVEDTSVEPYRTLEDGTKYYHMKTVARHSFILESVDNVWYILYEIPDGTDKENLPWMKEYVISNGYYSTDRFLYTEKIKNDRWWQDRISEGTYVIRKFPVSITKEEYAEWRVAIALSSVPRLDRYEDVY